MLRQEYTRLHRAMTGLICAAAVLWPLYAKADIPADSSAAVIFVYQRVGEDAVSQSNISLDQFAAHIKELVQGGYTVLPLSKIVDTLKSGGTLPHRTVAITFDGAYQATLANVMPILNDANMPFSVFFSPGLADALAPGHMNWPQLARLKKTKLVTLGILPADYTHMINQPAESNAASINKAVSEYRDNFGEEPAFFAYPYGEYNASLRKQLAAYRFKAVFGQSSGVAYAQSDFLALPRFTMTDDYGDFDRFVLTAHALPLPVADIVPEDTVLTQNPPHIGFTISPAISNITKLSCFASNGEGKLQIARLGGNRVELRPAKPFSDRRTRVNCTLPNATVTPGEQRSWRWFGLMYMRADQEEVDTGDAPAATENDDEDPVNQ